MYYGICDIWNKTTIEIDKQFIRMIAEHLPCKKNDPEPSTIEEVMPRSN